MGIHYMCNPRIHGPYVNPIQNIRGYLTTPQVDLTQDGDINDSHPGYTSGVELDISTLSHTSANISWQPKVDGNEQGAVSHLLCCIT